MNFKKLDDKKRCFLLFFLALFVVIPIVIFEGLPERDVASRYAPMAEAFASGDWFYAFHPRVPLLHPLFAGILAFLFGIGGFLAAKLASALVFAVGVFPLYGMMKRVFDARVAWGAGLLYVFCSHLIRLAGAGLRDSLKSLVFLIAAYGLIRLYQERQHFAGYFYVALGAGMMVMTRGDCALYALCFLGTVFFFELFQNGKIVFPKRTLLCGILFLFIITPQLLVNYFYIGYPVPEQRIGILFAKLEDRFGFSIARENPFFADELPSAHSESKIKKDNPAKEIAVHPDLGDEDDTVVRSSRSERIFIKPSGEDIRDFIMAVLKGFYPYFGVIAFLMVLIRIYRREWTVGETILLSILLGHALLLTGQIMFADRYLFMSRRYLLPVVPFEFGWTVLFILEFWNIMKRYLPNIFNRRLASLVITVLIILLLVDSYDSLRKSLFSTKDANRKDIMGNLVEYIRRDYDLAGYLPVTGGDPNTYFTAKRPLVGGPDYYRISGYLAGGFPVMMPMPERCRKILGDPDYLVGVETIPPDYVLIHEFRCNDEVVTLCKRRDLVKDFESENLK